MAEQRIDALRDRVAELEVALKDMLRLHDGKFLCRVDETDRECLNRETKRIVAQARKAVCADGGV